MDNVDPISVIKIIEEARKEEKVSRAAFLRGAVYILEAAGIDTDNLISKAIKDLSPDLKDFESKKK